jgi:hypothetical protein
VAPGAVGPSGWSPPLSQAQSSSLAPNGKIKGIEGEIKHLFLKCLYNHSYLQFCVIGGCMYNHTISSILNCIFVCPIRDCRASCIKVYSVLILNIDHSYGTWIPVDMGVTWQIIVVWPWRGWTKLTIGVRILSLKTFRK